MIDLVVRVLDKSYHYEGKVHLFKEKFKILREVASYCSKVEELQEIEIYTQPARSFETDSDTEESEGLNDREMVVGADIFQLADARYLLVVDYFSRYPEVIKLTTTTSTAVVNILKSIFSRHGIPEILRSDNGPQFDSQEMSAFASSYGFQLKTSSPHYPQSNGQAERAIRTVKRLLKKSSDPHMALLIYRSTPLNWCGYSPAELLMGRRLRSNLPLVREQLAPGWPYPSEFRRKDQEYKRKQKLNYDSRHRVRFLPCLPDNSPVYIRTKDKQVTGKVTTSTPEPRSYTVVTPNGQVRRNRHHLVPVPVDGIPPVTTSQGSETDTQSATIPQRPIIRSPIMTRSKTGTPINAPQRLTF